MSRSMKRMSPRMRFFFGRIFPLPFAIVGAVTFFFGVRGVIRAGQSSSWPTAEGKILSSSVERHTSRDKDGSSTTYHAEVCYEFTVNGQAYQGDRVAYGDYGSSSSSHAWRIVRRYPEGKAVTVHYMPDDPGECVLEAGRKLQAWFLPGFGLVFLVAGLAMLIFLPKVLRRAGKLREPPGPADSGKPGESAQATPPDAGGENPYTANWPGKK